MLWFQDDRRGFWLGLLGLQGTFTKKFSQRKKTIPQKRLVFISRLVVLCLVIAALVFGTLAKEYVFWLVLFAWGGLGAAFGPTLLLSLFWKRTTKAGVISGFVLGTTVTIVWNQIEALNTFIYYLVPAFFCSLFLTIIVSLFTSAPAQTGAELESIRAKYKR